MDAREELERIANDLLRHLGWARAKGVTELPNPRPTAPAVATPAAAAPTHAAPPAPREAPAHIPAAPPAPRQAPAPAEESAPAPRQAPLVALRRELGDCQRCKLAGGRRHIVFGEGNPRARLVFVGEGPGAEEDAQGQPFVGTAGQLLTKMIEAMGLSRDEVYICNVIKCRPPGNRNPEPDEIDACAPFLSRQIDAIGPEAIVTLGKFAAQTLLQSKEPISRLRGRWHSFQGIDLLPTFHPAYLLRSPQEKRKAWADLQQVMKKLGLRSPR